MRSALAGVVAVAGSAVLFALAFPPMDLRVLAWIALVPFFVALDGRSLAGAVALGWLWGVLAAYGVGTWFAGSISTYYAQPWVLGAGLFVAVASTMVAPYAMAFAAAHLRIARLPPAVAPILVAAAWAASELLRGRLFTGTPFFIGNPWGLLGYSQVGWLPVVQVASLGGVYAVSFVVASANAGIAGAIVALRARQLGLATACLTVGALPAVASIAFGSAALRSAPPPDQAGGVEVAVVQGNVAIGSQWRAERYGQNLAVYLRGTSDALASGAPRLVFWPESAMTFFVRQTPAFRRRIADVLGDADVELIAGGPSEVESATGGGAYFNSVFRIASDGELLGRYDKQYLVPFAEYFPFRGVDVLRREFGRVRVFEHGRGPGLLETRLGPAAVLVCNESMLPEVVGARVARGATYLVNPSNDSWISHPQYTRQQLAIATLRAVEQRRWLVRASTAGPSAIVDPWGRSQVESQPLRREVLLGSLEPRQDRSPYSRWGDLFGLACALAVVSAFFAERRAR